MKNGFIHFFKRHFLGVIDGLILLIIISYLADALQWSLWFSKSTATGGDMASHVPTAAYLKNVLLPKGRFIGWYPGNFCGFPLFQFYFPFPFLLMASANPFIPLDVAFKLISIMGIFMLPLCAYVGMSLARQKFPVPILAAIFTLPFLFSEGNSMWGGNILSNLSGEFAFQISFSLSVLFLLFIFRNIHTSAHVLKSGLLLGVIGLNHGVGLIFSLLVPLFFLIWPAPGVWRRTLYLLRIYGIALGIMAFWFFPFVHGGRWSTKFNLLWQLSDWKEVFPEILWPFLLLSFIVTVMIVSHYFFHCRKKKAPPIFVSFCSSFDMEEGSESHPLFLLLYFWFAIGISVFLFETAYELNVVDIRFLPYTELLPMFIAAMGIGWCSQFFKGTPILLLIILMGTGIWIHDHSKSVPAWARWNYTGFQQKESWSTFQKVNDFLKGDENDPRVVYEHSMAHNRFGTSRAFENLPYFSGRSTIEGLYVQSSITAPFAFYLQSEISSPGSCPLPQYDYSPANIEKAVEHFRLMNISHYITTTKPIQKLAEKNNDLELAATFDDIQIFKVRSSESDYVVPLDHYPFVGNQDNWRNNAYQWFRSYNRNVSHILFMDDPGKLGTFAEKTVALTPGKALQSVEIGGRKPVVKSNVYEDRIDIETSTVGWPLLVKVSYHPGWQCSGALGPFLISPSFMMIIPTENVITMRFGRSAAENWGGIATLFTLLLFLLRNIKPINWLIYGEWKISCCSISVRKQKSLHIFFWLMVLFLTSYYVIHKRTNSPMRMKQKAMEYYSMGELDNALFHFTKLLDRVPHSAYGDDANYFQALCHWRKKDFQKGAVSFSSLVDEYPNSHFVPESLYHIILYEISLGRKKKIPILMEQLVERYPENQWTRYAKQAIGRIK